MNILLLLHQPLDSGGDMPRALALGRELGRRGHRVSLLCEPPDSGFPNPESGIDYCCGPPFAPAFLRERGFHPLSLLWRASWLRDKEFDVVHTFGVRPTVALPARWEQRRGARWIADWSDYWGWGGIAAQRSRPSRWTVGALDAWLERSSRRRADGVIVVSSFLASLAEDWGVSQTEMLRIGGAADVETIRPLDKLEARQKLGFASGGAIVGFSGRSAFDLPLLASTFRQLHTERPEIRLLLFGGVGVSDLGLEAPDEILELGFLPQPKMAWALGCTDVMLLPLPEAPFNRARFPNRLGDYLAAARPVVTNPTGDAGRLVADEDVGLSVPEDPEAMAAAVLTLLDDPQRAEKMGARGRRVAEERMSWDRLAARMEAFYRRL